MVSIPTLKVWCHQISHQTFSQTAVSYHSACAAAWCTCFDGLRWYTTNPEAHYFVEAQGSLWLMLMSGSKKATLKQLESNVTAANTRWTWSHATRCTARHAAAHTTRHTIGRKARVTTHCGHWTIATWRSIQNELDERGKEFGKLVFPRIRIFVPYTSGFSTPPSKTINPQHPDTPIDWWNLHHHLWDGPSFFNRNLLAGAQSPDVLCLPFRVIMTQ